VLLQQTKAVKRPRGGERMNFVSRCSIDRLIDRSTPGIISETLRLSHLCPCTCAPGHCTAVAQMGTNSQHRNRSFQCETLGAWHQTAVKQLGGFSGDDQLPVSAIGSVGNFACFCPIAHHDTRTLDKGGGRSCRLAEATRRQ
jgi:hypothetical protein